jgi:gluconolactonase
MAFDDAGNLYVAHFSGSAVDVFDPQGHFSHKIAVPGPSVTNVAFGGDDSQTLFISEVETGSIYRTRVEISGQPLHDGR